MNIRQFVIIALFLLLVILVVSGDAKCKDNKTKCRGWARKRYCRKRIYKKYMRRECKKSCGIGICKRKPKPKPKPIPKTTPKPKQQAPKSACVDTGTNCAFWKSIAQCGRVQFDCKKTCDTCHMQSAPSSVTQRKTKKVKAKKAGWKKWASWTDCTKSCENGIRVRKRMCRGSWSSCKGTDVQRVICNKHPCAAEVTFNQGPCGQSNPVEDRGRIVGGDPAKEGEWPWQVGLLKKGEGGNLTKGLPICGGTLIATNVVLTAGHCFLHGARYGPDLMVRVGDYDLGSKGPEEKAVGVKYVVIHSEYRKRSYINDIAIMILAEHVTLGEDIRVACMPKVSDKFRECWATGWGLLNETKEVKRGPRPIILQEIMLPVQTTKECKKVYPGKQFRAGMMCAGFKEGGKDACQGDSGGPLVCEREKREKGKIFYQVGITSWGEGCARRGKYGVYTDVRKFLSWIKYTMDEHKHLTDAKK